MIVELWERYREDVLRYLTGRLRDPELARDLTQEVFVQLLQKEDELPDVRHLDRWIFRLARNRLIDHTRKRKEVRLDHEERVPQQENPSEFFLESISSCVEQLIAEYGSREADLLMAVFSGEFSQKEAAAKLGIPYSTMKSRIQKVRGQVLERFVDECCRFIRNSEGEVISCEPLTSAAESCC